MKKLTALGMEPSYIDRYTSIRESKHHAVRNQLIAVHQYVSAQYDAYRDAIDEDELSALQPDPHCAGASKALRACYDVSTIALRQLKEDIKSAQPTRQLQYCPMCGTTIPATFDHYLPAMRFPEFGVFALNLVPCCSQCNSTKDDDWLNAAGARQYLHAFADEIPDADVLAATLHEVAGLSGVGVTFELTRPAGIANSRWALLNSHFERLHLIERYNQLGNDEVAEVLADCRIFLEEGGPNVEAFLAARAAERRQAHGRNHWRAVLMDDMASHPNLRIWISFGRAQS